MAVSKHLPIIAGTIQSDPDRLDLDNFFFKKSFLFFDEELKNSSWSRAGPACPVSRFAMRLEPLSLRGEATWFVCKRRRKQTEIYERKIENDAFSMRQIKHFSTDFDCLTTISA